jgi:hypothetical protein
MEENSKKKKENKLDKNFKTSSQGPNFIELDFTIPDNIA